MPIDDNTDIVNLVVQSGSNTPIITTPTLPQQPQPTPIPNNVRNTNNVSPYQLATGNVDLQTLLSNYSNILSIVSQNIQIVTQLVQNAVID